MIFQIDPGLKEVLENFISEIRKDLIFFGSCGCIVALFMIWRWELKQYGIEPGGNFEEILLADFVSFNAFVFVFLGYLILSCATNILNDLNFPLEILKKVVTHIESRLCQISSTIISFLIGVYASIAVYTIISKPVGGFRLVIYLTLSIFVIFLATIYGLMIGRRMKLIDTLGWSLLILAISLSLLFFLIFFYIH